MKWRVLRFLCALLTVLCVLLWACSYRATRVIQYGWVVPGHPDCIDVIGIGGDYGRVVVIWIAVPKALNDYYLRTTKSSEFLGRNFQSYTGMGPVRWRDFWFNYRSFHQNLPVNADGTYPATSRTFAPRQLPISQYVISIPLWLPILLFGAAPIWQLINLPARRRRNRIAAGQCVSCGYDLRATPDRCPECGAISEKLSNLPTARQSFWRFCMRMVFGLATSLLFALALAACSSVLICQFLYQNMIGLPPQFLQSWTIFNRLVVCIGLCALGIISSALVSLLLVDGLRRLRSIPQAKN